MKWLFCSALALTPVFAATGYFAPTSRLSGLGIARQEISGLVLDERTTLMIESQTFAILRDPRALEGAKRINGPKLQALFRQAQAKSGVPASLLSAIAYLESWGIASAQSPAGPKGIMQVAEGTARVMGLRVVRARRYRTVTERVLVRRKKGKPVYKRVRRRIPYTVVVRDDRMRPERAIPAAGQYLAQLDRKFGGMDWAVFAYHCGEGCAAEFQSVLRESDGFKSDRPSVAAAFFGASPVYNRRLYAAIQEHMERDFSPTYWFRVTRAEQLLEMYRSERQAFERLRAAYQNRFNPAQRAPHRLSVWLRPDEVSYQNCDEIRRDVGTKLVKALEDSDLFGFQLRTTGAGALGEADPDNREYYMLGSPSVMGTLLYLTYETRRLHEAMNPRNERFQPLEVTGLVRPADYGLRLGRTTPDLHCTGQVFAVNYGNLPRGQREAMDFVLDEMGWMGYLGFIEESPGSNTMQIGCSPDSRDFFTRVYEEAAREAGILQSDSETN